MRATGKTTRLIDKIIQDVFEKGKVTVPDNGMLFSPSKRERFFPEQLKEMDTYKDPDATPGNRAQADLWNRLVKRILQEHGNRVGIKGNTITVI